MASRFQSPGWKRCRRWVRGIRITILFTLFLLVAAGVWLNQYGLPGFLKDRLVAGLRAHGLDLRFTRLRLRYYRGVVADNVRFGSTNALAGGPSFSAQEVELKLNHAALRRFQFKIDSIILHNGKFVWPLRETNQPPLDLAVNNIETQIRFPSGDLWELDQFMATFAGAQMQFAGSLTNASAMTNWPVFRAPAEAQPGLLSVRLRQLADTIDQIKFSDVPKLAVILHGDGRDPLSFTGSLTTSTLGAQTPWGTLTNGNLTVQLLAPNTTNRQPHLEFHLGAGLADTLWGGAQDFQLTGRAATDAVRTNLIRCSLELAASHFTTAWAGAAGVSFTARWFHSLTNAIPIEGQGELRLTELSTGWGRARELRLEARLGRPAGSAPPQADAGWGWWAAIEPYALDWDCHLHEVQAQEFQVAAIDCGGLWRAPELTVTNLHSELYQGQFTIQAGANVATRRLKFSADTDFDARSIPLLTDGSCEWLDQCAWEKPPLVHLRGEMTLPAWTNAHPDLRAEVLPTLALSGEVGLGPSSFHGLPVNSVHSSVTCSNEVWNLPDIVIARPEGEIKAALQADDRNQEFRVQLHSQIDIQALRPLFDTNVQAAFFNQLTLTQPPVIDAGARGRWTEPEHLSATGSLALTNFTYRGTKATSLQSALQYSNLFLECLHPRVERGAEFAQADSVGVDIPGRRLYLTNGYGHMEPAAFIQTLGPDILNVMRPYLQFQNATALANGVIPLSGDVPADIHFAVEGGPFHWMKFNFTKISGGVHWVGDHLALTGVRSEFYEGRLNAAAGFDFGRGEGADFTLDSIVTSANFGLMMKDLFNPTNHLEGTLTGHLSITNANTAEWKSWFGKGQVNLRDGLLWDIPVFGAYSKALDFIHPGLGESRATEGSASFIITNGVIRTDDLTIHATAMRLNYRGTSDFDGRINATVEAEALHDTPLVGNLVSPLSLIFEKIFESKVTGTLSQPKIELNWTGRILMTPFHWIFHPITTLKEMVPPLPGPNDPRDDPGSPPGPPPQKPR